MTWNNFKYDLKRFLGIPRVIILCIRFPFLYPRNVWTNKHYNNWKIQDKRSEIHRKYYFVNFNGNGTVDQHWTNKWYKFYWNFLGFLESFLAIFHCIPTYTLFDWIPSGWKKAFGIQMCKEIRRTLYKDGGLKCLFKYRVLDIKEKYGSLRWVGSFDTADLDKILAKYEYISERTCISCGELATCETPLEYWRCPYCDNCAPKNSKYLLDFGLYSDWYGLTGNVNYRSKEELKIREQMVEDYKNIE